jgi:hypothetical protein
VAWSWTAQTLPQADLRRTAPHHTTPHHTPHHTPQHTTMKTRTANAPRAAEPSSVRITSDPSRASDARLTHTDPPTRIRTAGTQTPRGRRTAGTPTPHAAGTQTPRGGPAGRHYTHRCVSFAGGQSSRTDRSPRTHSRSVPHTQHRTGEHTRTRTVSQPPPPSR